MLMSMLVFCVAGYLVGLHAPLWISIPLVIIALIVSLKEEGLQGVQVMIVGALPYTVGTVLSILIYHTDLGAVGSMIKFIFTGD